MRGVRRHKADESPGMTLTKAGSNTIASAAPELSIFTVTVLACPGGEIRGQLQAVPEPSTWAMMLPGFGAVGFAMSCRKRTELTFNRAA